MFLPCHFWSWHLAVAWRYPAGLQFLACQARVAVFGTVAPASAEAIRILAGSLKPHIDRAGRRWGPDAFFTGGAAQPGPTDFLARPADASLYRQMRYGDFSYALPAPPGVYELWLHFAEPTYRGGNDVGSEGGENQRHFSVA